MLLRQVMIGVQLPPLGADACLSSVSFPAYCCWLPLFLCFSQLCICRAVFFYLGSLHVAGLLSLCLCLSLPLQKALSRVVAESVQGPSASCFVLSLSVM